MAKISEAAFKLYVVLLGHCYGENKTCFPSRRRLAQIIRKSERQISYLIRELEAANLVAVHQEKGKVSIYEPLQKIAGVADNPCRKLQETPAKNCNTPLQETATESIRTNNKKLIKEPASPSTRKKSSVPRDKASLENLLSQINLDGFRAEYPSLDIDRIWSRFQKKVLYGIAQNPRPNPYGYTEFGTALDEWCKRAIDKGEDQKPIPKAGLPDLRRYKF